MRRILRRLAFATLACAVLAEAAVARAPDAPKPYLDHTLLPDAARILPPPPLPGSPAAMLDAEVFLHSRGLKQQDPQRWALATRDAQRDTDRLLGDFACALGVSVSRDTAPALYRLLDRADRDIWTQADAAKQRFNRARPYIHNHQPICVARFTRLDRSSSYPSGHATQGWMVALILTELVPERSSVILARGRAFGESRIACGVHWLSDVQAGMLNGAAVLAALHSSGEFRADLQQARREIAVAGKSAATSPASATCAIEQDAEAHSLLTRPQP